MNLLDTGSGGIGLSGWQWASKRVAGTLSFVLLICFSYSAAAVPIFQITDLGVLDGDYRSQARGINIHGQVVGSSSTSTGNRSRAFVWDPLTGTMTNLGALSGVDRYGRSFSRANAINDVGQIVGSSTQCGENASYCGSTAVLWQNDTILDIGPFPSSRVQATDINNLGQVVGQWGDGNIFEMFYWRPDTGIVDPGDVPWPPKDISFGLDGERARGINDHGQVVGVLQGEYPDKKGFVWDQNSGFTPIGYDLGPGRRIEARDINNLGQIVGFNSDGYSGQGFIMIDGLMVEIGELSGGWSGSGPSSINDAGQVVGGSFLWDQYLGLLDLNDLISPLDPLYGSTTILNAFDINNYGQIVGVADFGGVRRGFLATPVPVPEPGTLALFGIGLLGMGLSRRRKKLSQVA